MREQTDPKPALSPELVIGLVGPIGVNIDAIQDWICEALKQVDYKSEIVHVSKLLDGAFSDSIGSSQKTDLGKKIEKANRFCSLAEDGAALAALAVGEIRSIRKRENLLKNESNIEKPISGQAYIIRQLKRRKEIDLLRNIYGEKFIQISISLAKEARVQKLSERLSRDHVNMKIDECDAEARRLIQVDEDEKDDLGNKKEYGQQLEEIFHTADFFVNSIQHTKVSEKLSRFVRALFGDNSISPTKDEFGAYMAAAAALRSCDLSRQVGAAIFNPIGDIVSMGCNEVPKAGGGNYWFEDEEKMRDYERGAEQNSVEKQRIITDFIDRLKAAKVVHLPASGSQEIELEKLRAAVDDSLISDITEYGRMTHAEMSAICDAARTGRPLHGTTIFVTTFPCHNCAKHIVASGINRVVYIEPYPKSRATQSHPDSISMDSRQDGKVLFEHFEGISPRRYREIFQKGRRRRGDKIQQWADGVPVPRISELDDFHVRKEVMADFALSKVPKLGKRE